MIKIGDFSKLSQISVRMLRYYEEMGLFKPQHVDRFTGYRYYSVDQLPRLNRILALRDLGLTLEQVAQLLAQDLPAERLRGMLVMKQAEIEQQVQAEQQRLERVKARLRQIEQETLMPSYDVILKEVEPQTVASVRKIIPQPQDVGSLMETLFTTLERQGVRPAGAPCAIWHDQEHKEQDWDAEVAVAIQGALTAQDGVLAGKLDGVAHMASTIHQGRYEDIPAAYTAIMRWIEANGYGITGPTREIYLRGPEGVDDDPATFVTEIQFPVEKL